jgi:hypothetical protein
MEGVSIVSTNEQKEVRVEVRLPKTGFGRTMFFNRFRVDHEKDFCLVHFGLMSGSGMLVEQYCVFFSRETLERHKKALVPYLERIGLPKETAPPAWQGPLAVDKVDVVDIVNVAFRGDVAEIALCIVSLNAVAMQARSKPTEALEAQPVALLRSTLETQKQLLVALYES